MKRIMYLLVLMGLIGLVACNSQEDATENGDTAATTTEQATDSASQRETREDVDVDSLEWGQLRPEGLSEDYPARQLIYSYAFGAGSPQDAYIRTLFSIIQKNEGWNNNMVVQYNEGASGRIGWTSLVNADKDGYTIGFTPTAMLIPANSEDVEFQIEKFDMIFNMMSDPGVVGVAADSEFETLEDLMNAAKDNPGTISIGVTSTIGQEGLTVTLLERASGAQFNVTPFNSEPDVLAGVQGGHVDAFCLNVSDATTFVENGAVKFLATGDTERSEFYPEIPTYQEAGYDVTQVNMRAISAPEGTDPLVLEYLENCLLKAASDPEAVEKAEELQIPVDTLGANEVTKRFEELDAMYKELWETDPWN